MTMAEFNELEDILDDVRTRFDETPRWEFCEGFMAAVICCRRVIHLSEYLSVLLDTEETNEQGEPAFIDEAQFSRFTNLWIRRWNEIAAALMIEVDNLADERAYHPEVIDVRGAISVLRTDDASSVPGEKTPSFAQVWAIGFMYAVEAWPEEWEPPRDKQLAGWIDGSLSAIVALTEDDEGPFTRSFFEEGAPPSVSDQRSDEYGDAVWAVYTLRKIMGSLGPRVETVRKDDKPGRNDPCFCGSGKKYKKCHGAG
jgi:uncharacterized protein